MRLSHAPLVIIASSMCACGLSLASALSTDTKVTDAGADQALAAADSSTSRDDSGSEPDASPGSCASNRYLFCDDFEDGTLDKWTPRNIPTNGTAQIETTHACSGTHSLHVRAVAGTHNTKNFFAMLGYDRLPSFPDHFFVRLFVSFDGSATAGPVFVQTQNEAGQGIQEEAAGGFLVGQSYNLGTGLDRFWGGGQQGPLAPSTCACVELEVDRPGSVVRTKLDGGLFAALAFQDASIPPFRTLVVGLSYYNPSSTIVLGNTEQVWLDDVVLNDNPIGCGQ
jgi:hypothetical protein